MSEIYYNRAKTTQELNEILELQNANISSNISNKDKFTEGFVTVYHTLEILKAMNDKCPHIIAKCDGKVIGYALCMHKDFKDNIDILKPMFKQIDNCLKTSASYMVMGQVCIESSFRKKGVFRGLYNFMKEKMKLDYDLIITEVDQNNTRSMNAHQAIGFKILYSYQSNSQDWNILYLNTDK